MEKDTNPIDPDESYSKLEERLKILEKNLENIKVQSSANSPESNHRKANGCETNESVSQENGIVNPSRKSWGTVVNVQIPDQINESQTQHQNISLNQIQPQVSLPQYPQYQPQTSLYPQYPGFQNFPQQMMHQIPMNPQMEFVNQSMFHQYPMMTPPNPNYQPMMPSLGIPNMPRYPPNGLNFSTTSFPPKLNPQGLMTNLLPPQALAAIQSNLPPDRIQLILNAQAEKLEQQVAYLRMNNSRVSEDTVEATDRYLGSLYDKLDEVEKSNSSLKRQVNSSQREGILKQKEQSIVNLKNEIEMIKREIDASKNREEDEYFELKKTYQIIHNFEAHSLESQRKHLSEVEKLNKEHADLVRLFEESKSK